VPDLNSPYSVEIDRVTKAGWSKLLYEFVDANIYQTWSYGAVRWGESNLSHLLLFKDGAVTAMAQVAIKKIPFLRAGIGYAPWGPVWKRKGHEPSFQDLKETLGALREEYVKRRGLLLRLAPGEIEETGDEVKVALETQGYALKRRHYRTLLIDLGRPMDELLKASSRRWRRALKAATEKGLTVWEGTDDATFQILEGLHREMVARKGFLPGVDISEFRKVQEDLPQKLKMKIMICEHDGTPVAALMASLIGVKGVGLLGATSAQGLNMGGFHLLNWKMMEWMKVSGAQYYDFGGYDPEKNPGTAGFKEGLDGLDVSHVGQYEVCVSPLSVAAVQGAELLRKVPDHISGLFKKVGQSPAQPAEK
jgi:lipid II:glycine glycyltransferase (peptidoglycan interpeptide bridge formation enzyme)